MKECFMSEFVKSEVAFTQSDIEAAIAKITKAGKSMVRGIESVLVMAVYDSIVNESATVANALVSALRLSTKKAGIIAFLEKFGQLYDQGGKVGFVHFALGTQSHLAWSKDYVETVQEEAQSWESFKPAPPPVAALDIIAELEAILTKEARAQKVGRTVLHAELAVYITPLIVQFKAREAMATASESSKELVTA
jgi:hypothetical protein